MFFRKTEVGHVAMASPLGHPARREIFPVASSSTVDSYVGLLIVQVFVGEPLFITDKDVTNVSQPDLRFDYCRLQGSLLFDSYYQHYIINISPSVNIYYLMGEKAIWLNIARMCGRIFMSCRRVKIQHKSAISSHIAFLHIEIYTTLS